MLFTWTYYCSVWLEIAFRVDCSRLHNLRALCVRKSIQFWHNGHEILKWKRKFKCELWSRFDVSLDSPEIFHNFKSNKNKIQEHESRLNFSDALHHNFHHIFNEMFYKNFLNLPSRFLSLIMNEILLLPWFKQSVMRKWFSVVDSNETLIGFQSLIFALLHDFNWNTFQRFRQHLCLFEKI